MRFEPADRGLAELGHGDFEPAGLWFTLTVAEPGGGRSEK